MALFTKLPVVKDEIQKEQIYNFKIAIIGTSHLSCFVFYQVRCTVTHSTIRQTLQM